MRTPFTTFPDEPTFEEIAAEWPLGGKATDAATILERIIQFMWRGDFEERGRPTLFLAGPPDGCDMDADGVVTRRRPERLGGAPYVLVAPTWSGPGGARNVARDGRGLPFRRWAILYDGGWIDCDDPRLSDPAFREEIIRYDCPDDPEDFEGELVTARVCHPHTRAQTLACLKACGFRIEGMTGSPDAMFMVLAKLPLRDYETDRGRFSVTPRRLRIRLADLAEWFDTSGLDWPRPAWLPLPIALPAVALPDPTPARAAFPDRKANFIRDVAERWERMSGVGKDIFLEDVIPAIRSGELAVMARSRSQDRRVGGALLPMPLETIEIMTRGWPDEDKRTKEFACGLMVTREALAAWWRPGVPQMLRPTLDELWPPRTGASAADRMTTAQAVDTSTFEEFTTRTIALAKLVENDQPGLNFVELERLRNEDQKGVIENITIPQGKVFVWLDENHKKFNIKGKGSGQADVAFLKYMFGENFHNIGAERIERYLATVKMMRKRWNDEGGPERRR